MENTMMNNVEEAMEEMIPTMPATNQDMAIITEEPKKAVAKISKNHKLLKIGAGAAVVFAVHKLVGKRIKNKIRGAIKGIVREVMAEEAAKGQPPVETEVVTETEVKVEEG